MFCSTCGNEVNEEAVVCPSCGVQLKPLRTNTGSGILNRWIAIILALFTGSLGIQWFYLRRPVYGVLSILFFWTFIPSLVALIQIILLLVTSDEAFDAKYNTKHIG